jgi:hypothetical protein
MSRIFAATATLTVLAIGKDSSALKTTLRPVSRWMAATPTVPLAAFPIRPISATTADI